MKTQEMEIALANHFNYRQNLIIPNVSWGFLDHEADLIVISKSNYLIEIEIKVSASDLKKDKNKKHSHCDRENRIKALWFVLPEALISHVNHIPENAGILIVSKNKNFYRVKTMRSPKPYKKFRKLTDDEILKLYRLASMRTWSLKQKLLNLSL
jgi:hypothetical protein